jgi:Zn-dependent protease with chaperone function
MARCISILLTMAGQMTLGIGQLLGRALEATLLEWDRMSEFTADRFALMVVQDPQVMLSLMMKFAGGTLFQRDQMDAREFLKQADLYERVDANLLDRLYKLMLVAPTTHPLIIVRAREVLNWSESREYTEAFVATSPPPASEPGLVGCSHCGGEQTNQRFCSLCGEAIS